MIQPNRIASGLADSLLSSANPDANPEPLIEAAFRRGVRLGLSIGAASRGCPNARPSLREGGASWTVLIDPPDPRASKLRRIAWPSISSSIASAQQAAAIPAYVIRRAGAGPHGGAISCRRPCAEPRRPAARFRTLKPNSADPTVPNRTDKKAASSRDGGLFSFSY